MPTDKPDSPEPDAKDTPLREDGPLSSASEAKVLEETARLAREGREQLESDPKEKAGE